MNKATLIDIYRRKGVSIRFVIIGGVGFVCNYAVLWTGTEKLGLQKILAELIAAAVALQVTFLFHDRWTYRNRHEARQYHLSLWRRYRLYVVSNSFASLLTVVFFALFSLFLSHFEALALSALAGLLWNFFMNKAIIWRHAEQAQTTNFE